MGNQSINISDAIEKEFSVDEKISKGLAKDCFKKVYDSVVF